MESMKEKSQHAEDSHSAWIMAESEHYVLQANYEEVALRRKSDNALIAYVGDFYGDAVAGIIDADEKFCVTVGCGVIVYKLQEPFESYMYDRSTSQWYEFGRNPADIDWIDDVRQIGPNEIELTDVSGIHRNHRIQI